MTYSRLPIDAHIPDILAAFKSHGDLVLIASPGAGKTTRVPLAILDSGFLKPSAPGILMLEPRRLAARAAAARMASERGTKLGEEIGYQVRFDNRTTENTRLCVMTEGLLARRLVHDPRLEGIGCVILDEFHERSWHTDLALGLLRELKELERPDLHIVVMSATLRANPIAAFLNSAPIVDVKAEAHPLEIRHDRTPQLLVTGPEFTSRVSTAIVETLTGARESRGDILVFLPGAREIRDVAAKIDSPARTHETEVHVLHGGLKLEDQNVVIQRSTRRKIILATNIAETSLTIDGVATVIDSGLAKIARLDATGFPRLELSRISRFSAIQRAGRAGRQGPGICHRLWTKLDEASMPETESPEIHRIDLTEAILLLLHLGVGDPQRFSWFEAPEASAIHAALSLLSRLDAIAPEWSNSRGLDNPHGSKVDESTPVPALTDIGRRLLEWPLHPRLARLMEAARGQREHIATAARLCALISEKDILSDAARLKNAAALESDVLLRLEALEGRLVAPLDRGAVAQVKRASEQIERIALSRRDIPFSTPRLDENHPERELLLIAYPDRVARRRRRGEPEALLVGGRGLRLGKYSCVELSDLFVGIDAVNGATLGASPTTSKIDMVATIASGIERQWLRKRFPDRVREIRRPVLDRQSGRVQLHIFEAYDDLPLEDPRLAEAKEEDIARLLPSLVAEEWTGLLARNESAARWLERYEFLLGACPEYEWPSFHPRDPNDPGTRQLIESLCLGERSLARVAEKDPTWHFENAIGPELATRLRSEAPDSVTVPTGNRMRVHYPAGRAPYVEVRIQEVFGWRESPKVAGGRVRVVLHLLGPNFRPVQVTSDLSSFWANGYSDVRKELRARYPKHSWPDDPLSAPPQAKGRRPH